LIEIVYKNKDRPIKLYIPKRKNGEEVIGR
jgi:hypothetical protein